MRHFYSDFMYCDVLTLGVACWTAAILSLYYARIKMKAIHKKGKTSKSDNGYSKLAPDGTYHAFSNPGKDPLLSQDELRIIYHNLRAMREEERYRLDPQTHPGLEIKSILLHALGSYREPRTALSKFALEAFPEATELLELTAFAFERGTIVVDCVPVAAMADTFPDVRAITYSIQGEVHILVGCEMMRSEQQQSSITSFCQT